MKSIIKKEGKKCREKMEVEGGKKKKSEENVEIFHKDS